MKLTMYMYIAMVTVLASPGTQGVWTFVARQLTGVTVITTVASYKDAVFIYFIATLNEHRWFYNVHFFIDWLYYSISLFVLACTCI